MVVAPFRALCEEIRQSLFAAFSGEGINVDELSDVQQDDFNLEAFLSRRQVLVMTPEKCLYPLRHSPEVTDTLGLLIFDEGHQFDSGSRGVTNGLAPFPRPNDPGQTNKRAWRDAHNADTFAGEFFRCAKISKTSSDDDNLG
jgi:Superfamily II helicase